jgi:hypothetical protein
MPCSPGILTAMIGNYWRKVGLQSFTDTCSRFGLDSRGQIVLKVFGTVVVVLALLFLGSEDAATDEMLVRGALAALVALLFPAFFAWKLVSIPAALDKERADEIARLSGEIASLTALEEPCLAFQYHPNDNKNLEAITEKLGNRVKHSLCGRVAIKNDSKDVSIEDVEVTLVNWKKDGYSSQVSIDKRILSNSSRNASITLHPQRGESFNLFRTKADGDLSFIKWGPFENGLTEQVDVGKYRVKVAASGKDTNHAVEFYLVHVESSGVIAFRPWKEGDTTHDGPPLNDKN